MLNIYFGDIPEAVYNTSVYFNYTYEDEWLTSDFAKEVIKKIDKSDVKGPHAVESPVLGVISPEKLSGGTKTLMNRPGFHSRKPGRFLCTGDRAAGGSSARRFLAFHGKMRKQKAGSVVERRRKATLPAV